MRLPGVPVPVRIPIALMDRPPEGEEAELFTYELASKWNDHLVLVDVPATRKVVRQLVDAFGRFPGLLNPL